MGRYTKNLFKKKNKFTPAKPAASKFDETTVDDSVVVTSAMVEGETPIKLWVDDTRPPECDPFALTGWIWVKTIREALDLFDENEDYVVTHLALDYYMDHNWPGAPSGAVIVDELTRRFHLLGRDKVFANVVRVNCHSSDRDCRVKTGNVVRGLQEEGLINKSARVSIQQARNNDREL